MRGVILARHPGVVSDVVDGKAVLVDPGGREIITLNALGSVVWELVDGSRDVDEVCRLVGERHPDVAPEQISADVQSFVQELSRLGVLDAGSQARG
jgi:hypothetical protein